MLLKEEASNFLLWDFKNENVLARSCLRILAGIWLESSIERLFTNSGANGLHYFNEREQD